MNLDAFLVASIVISVLAFGFAWWLFGWVKQQPAENKRIAEISGYIRKGAATFLNQEYRVLAKFSGCIAVLILLFLPAPLWKGSVLPNIMMAVSYIAGTAFSAFAGKIGIQVATIANGKTAEAAQKGIRPPVLTGFRGGAVMGMAVVGSFSAGGRAGLLDHRRQQRAARVLLWCVLPGAVRQGGRRHLHQDRRHRSRPDRQGGTGHP